jgi:hypothetical protein
MNDPCACDVACPHGERCFGGHANYPDSHWYGCETCSPRKSTVYILSDSRYLAVMAGCGHAVGPYASARDITLAGMKHHRACMSTDLV